MASDIVDFDEFDIPGVNAGEPVHDAKPCPARISVPVPPPNGLPLLKLNPEWVSEDGSQEPDPVTSLQRQPGVAQERGGEQHPLISWFEKEVRPELAGIRRDLDKLLLRGDDKITAFPKARSGARKLTDSNVNRTGPDEQSKTKAFKRALTTLSCVPSDKPDAAPSNALEAIFSFNPDASTKEKFRRQTTQLAEVVPAVPSSGESGAPTISQSFTSHQSNKSNKSMERRDSLSSLQSQKEIEKAAVLSRFQRRRLKMFERAWNMLEDPESSTLARWCARVMPAFILFAVSVTLLQMVNPPLLHGVLAAVLETTIETVFLLEFLFRLIVCPNHWTFWLDFFNLVDLAVAAPLAVRISMGLVLPVNGAMNWELGILFCAVPIIRMLKLLRRFEKFHLLLKAFSLAAEALPVLLYMLFVIELIFSMLIYLVEPRENIPSLFTAIWLTMVTMTTVGYGDVTPTSAAGSIITGVLVVITVLYMAIPLGIIGNAFTATWNERDRILLMKRTRDRLRQWGYTAHDIPVLFRLSDSNDDGELDLTEFRDLLRCMKIGFSDERIFQLFRSFDQDHSGTVDDREFVRALFPNSYHDIYDEENGG